MSGTTIMVIISTLILLFGIYMLIVTKKTKHQH